MSGSRLEKQTMSDVSDNEVDVDWKGIASRLREGRMAEIPCEERDCARLERKITRRAERWGITVEVIPGEGVLRVEPGPATAGNAVAQPSGRDAEAKGERQRKREERR